MVVSFPKKKRVRIQYHTLIIIEDIPYRQVNCVLRIKQAFVVLLETGQYLKNRVKLFRSIEETPMPIV